MSNKIIYLPPFVPGQLSQGALGIVFKFKCIDCAIEFEVRSGHAKRCTKCKVKYRKDYKNKLYKKLYSKERKAYGKRVK